MSERWIDWIGKPLRTQDLVAPPAVTRFAAMLDSPQPADASAPQGFHWCLCLPDAPTAEIDVDGHPRRGTFLPPIELPRRMWVGSDVSFVAPLPVGAKVERVSTVASVAEKVGSSGRLAFVEIDHVTSAHGTVTVRERQTIVYREAAAPAQAAVIAAEALAPPDLSAWMWQRRVVPSEVLLFRYSALTFNSHRIHYDLPYATQVEGYPGLVVQGPLTASLLLDLCARELGPDALASFAFRARTPAFAGEALHLVGRRDGSEIALAALGGDGRTIISATATARS
jgi:3-methylfumaryl-CoA hydratase